MPRLNMKLNFDFPVELGQLDALKLEIPHGTRPRKVMVKSLNKDGSYNVRASFFHEDHAGDWWNEFCDAPVVPFRLAGVDMDDPDLPLDFDKYYRE